MDTTTNRRRSDRRIPWHVRLGLVLVSEWARLAALVAFAMLVAFTGGSSRSDVPALIVLRPAAVLFLAYALLVASAGQLREVRAPMLILGSLMLLALLQLVPLPAVIWTGLPHRDVVAEISALLGMGEIARPLSLDPNRTWNTLFALFVPLATIGLMAIQGAKQRRWIFPLLVAVGAVSAAIGLMQALAGGGLYFYRITHVGYPVGLFANKNHQAVMLLWLMMAACLFGGAGGSRRRSEALTVGGALAAILVLFPLLILTGSRAGLLLSVPTLALCAWMLFRGPSFQALLRRAGAKARLLKGLLAAILIGPLVFVFGALATSGRRTALSRLFELDVADDVRSSYFSILVEMALDYLPFGSGFGSFEEAFNAFEPSALLSSRYLNHAHNDLVELVIEGGVPGLVILLGALAWLGRSFVRAWRAGGTDGRIPAVFYVSSICLWLAASLVDYPLRTPLGAMLVAGLTVQLSFLSTGTYSGSAVPDKRDRQGRAY
jgi:Lipid A core - O-antigen ligase and related enzymes